MQIAPWKPTIKVNRLKHAVWCLVLISSLLLIAGCNLPTSSGDSARETQIALNVNATRAAEQRDEANPTETKTPTIFPTTQDVPPTLDETATTAAEETSIAQKVETSVAHELTKAAEVPTATKTPTEAPTAAPQQDTAVPVPPTDTPEPTPVPPTETPPGPDLGSFEAWSQNVSILLFEDMAGDFTTTRYVKKALDGMGLGYIDVKDALGRYKDQLLSGGPGGAGWDLIISAKEARGGVSGEFYEIINDALNNGSGVIIEEWDLDEIGLGKVNAITSRCGVEFQRDWWADSINAQLLWPINGEHPIHHQPNEGISLRNPTGFWAFELGDFIRLAPGSNAVLLWGARSNITDSYATAVSCEDGRLILQTYATHNYGQDRVVLMWQNYIYNTLLARYQLLQQQ